jgi:hypothetical protein
MELEAINKLYLELSQIATATTNNEECLFQRLKKSNDLLRSAYQIAERNGEKTDWQSFKRQLLLELEVQKSYINNS